MKTKRMSRLLVCLLTLVMVVGLLPTGLFSLTAYADTGNGTEDDPYIVTTYDDLLDKARGDAYIKLGADIIQEDNLTDLEIAPGMYKTVYLDLNGHTLSRTCRSGDSSLFVISSASFLTIDDSSEGKTGSVSFLNSSQDDCAIFINTGYLTINGGSYEIINKKTAFIIYNINGGTTEINGGVFQYHTQYLFYALSENQSDITGDYPFLVINGGEFYCDPSSSPTPPRASLTAYCPIFVTGGTFINTAENGVFVRNQDSRSPLIYCGGTFRPRDYFMDTHFIKVPGTFSATTTIDGLDYAMNEAPVVITPGSEVDDMAVSIRLLLKCLKQFREYAADSIDSSWTAWFQKRYPHLLDETYSPEMLVINRSDLTAPELSIQYKKTIRNTMQWYRSTDGINFTEIPDTAGKQTITPPDALSACTMYYRCNYVSHPGVPSSDTIKVVYKSAPINAVNITGLDKPIADQPADFTADETVAYTVSDILWKDTVDGNYLTVDEPVSGGRIHSCSFTLEAKEGFNFTADTTVDVGILGCSDVTVTRSSSKALIVRFYVWVDYSYVKNFNIINITPPVAGQHPNFTADSADEKIKVTEVEWFQCFGDYLTLTAEDTFEAGKEYYCYIYFEGNEDEGYSLDNTGLTATINGIPGQINHAAGANTANIYEIYTATGTVQGNTVSGRITSFGDTAEDTIIQLIPSGASEAAYEVLGKTKYSIADVVAGTYTVKVMKNKHCTETYTITVSGSAVTLDVEIWLLGDMDMNGLIDSRDALKLFNAAAGKTTLTEQENRIGDMNLSGGDVNMLDAQKLFNMAAGVVTL